MSVLKFTNTILEPLGLKARSFSIDYKDKNGKDYNNDVVIPAGKCSDDYITNSIIKDSAKNGYAVTAIFEMLNGYDKAELEQLMRTNPQEAIQHLRLMYYS